MGEAAEVPSRLDMLYLDNQVAIASARCRRDDVLIEGEGNEYNYDQEIDYGADGTHGLWSEAQFSILRQDLRRGNCWGAEISL